MKTFFKYYLLIFLLFSVFKTFAQEEGPGSGTEPSFGGTGLENGDPPPAPIDGDIAYLAIIGILFVFYIYRKNKQRV